MKNGPQIATSPEDRPTTSEPTPRSQGAPPLVEDLLTPGVELRETHISWVFLTETDVFKVKKPVSLGFLDFTTQRQRLQACEAEVRLNRRLAPGIYRGVVPVTLSPRGHHELRGSGQVVDWAVHMVRLPDAHRADRRLAEGRLERSQVDCIARHLVSFHGRAACDAQMSRFGTAEAMKLNVTENFDQTRDVLQDYLSPDEVVEIETWQNDFLDKSRDLFDRRIAAGRVRDGHGDLRLEHVYLDDEGGVTIVDCIEFNRRFRYGDVAADLAFLPMDLAWHGRADLAEGLLAAYARAANDYDLYAVVDFYESYRAFVRGKIASLLAREETNEHAVRQRAAEEARRYFLLALASRRRRAVEPAMVAVGGVLASGKSTVATRLAAELAAPVVDADGTRMHLLGIEPTEKVYEPAFQGAYAPGFTDQVYAEVMRRAETVLASGRSVVLDATFRSRALRLTAWLLAKRHRVPFHFVECRASVEKCRRRLLQRQSHVGVSDGRLEIFDEFLANWEPVDELPPSIHHPIDTERTLAHNLQELRRKLPTWPAGPTS